MGLITYFLLLDKLQTTNSS